MSNIIFPPANSIITPVGSVIAYAGCASSSPGDNVRTQLAGCGWLICDGAALSAATYCTLFETIGYSYGGSGDIFNLPDYRGLGLKAANATDSGASITQYIIRYIW